MSNKNVLIFGTDLNSEAQPFGVTGAENNRLKIKSIKKLELYYKIIKELQKLNQYVELLTDNVVTNQEVEDYKQNL